MVWNSTNSPQRPSGEFLSSLIKELCTLLKITKSRTTPYHPQGDGVVERLNQILMHILRVYVADHQKDWDCWLTLAVMFYKTAKQSSTRETPFKLLFGRDPVLVRTLPLIDHCHHLSDRIQETTTKRTADYPQSS